MAFTWKGDGKIVTVVVPTSKTATAGYLAEMTDDYTARDNETVSSATTLGVFVTTGVAGDYVAVLNSGVVTLTAGSAGTTAGTTVVVDNAAAQKVEDGSAAGTVLGRALTSSIADADTDILLGHC